MYFLPCLTVITAHGLVPGSIPAMHFACNTTGPENATQLKQLSKYSTVIFGGCASVPAWPAPKLTTQP